MIDGRSSVDKTSPMRPLPRTQLQRRSRIGSLLEVNGSVGPFRDSKPHFRLSSSNPVTMLKSLLILALITMQILAGLGGSFYLCISNDGSHWCVEADPTTCTCCHQHDAGGADCQAGCAHATTTEESRPEGSGHATLASTDPECGCTHILIGVEQPSRQVSSAPLDSLWPGKAFALTDSALEQELAIGTRLTTSFTPDAGPLPSSPLAFLSSVMLRC